MRLSVIRTPPLRPRRPSPRTVGGWFVLAATLTLLGGRAGLALAVAVVLWDLLFAPSPRALMLAALLALLAVPVAVMVRGLPTMATLSPDFAAGSLLPHVLAGIGLALLVLGILRDVRANLPRSEGRAELGVPAGPDRALLVRQVEDPAGVEAPARAPGMADSEASDRTRAEEPAQAEAEDPR